MLEIKLVIQCHISHHVVIDFRNVMNGHRVFLFRCQTKFDARNLGAALIIASF